MDFEIRGNRGRPQGRKALVREREEYFRLMGQGVSSREACRIVGVNRMTGKRWRNGRRATGAKKGALPVRRPGGQDGPSRFLREADRIHIADRLREKASIRTIAAELGRSPSTISREVRRNGAMWRSSGWAYRPHAAQSRADARRPRPKPGKIGQNPELRDFIQDHLQRRWSPEQICQALRARFPDRPEMHVVHETIYQALYVQGRGELRRELTQALRTGRVMRRPHRQSYKRQPRMSAGMVMISERPAEVADRAIPGHWEGDLIIGKTHQSAIGTLVERSSRFVTLVHLPDGRLPSQVRDALVQTVSTLPAQLRRSLTWDQGSEMALHRQFSTATDMPVFFCDPASPWQRGSNENTNGLLRQYFPKGTDLARHSREDLDTVAAELNSRPRKTLGWETPAERLAKLLTTAS
ncbi:IS30 family transposase [Streptomyces albidoflavus]|uniref:IS30 family transposase n=3 Tax=Streptomyces TaxID=1883 RepID=UPI000CD4B469|nr:MULTISPECIES: IS30 family transposase [unclassified Streptomyces]WSD55225.1 IS30 family transposase [Streptomyces albidoflavus]WTC43030.1 IS30 family transposase [Streptomyces albidoflavus]WTC43890.1 IS30 family transposase [Streptomyces albidoflavus]WTD41694.1 IS30 family transposase [Streptomyces albidoflavus]WTD42549.1 IS30 family transposase [Streptomyces albidoflavus]